MTKKDEPTRDELIKQIEDLTDLVHLYRGVIRKLADK
jgi:hypothetical protein